MKKKKDILRKYKDKWTELDILIYLSISEYIKAKNDNYLDHDEKYVKIEIDAGDDLALEKTLEMHHFIILFGSVFINENKYYPQVVLGKCLHELAE